MKYFLTLLWCLCLPVPLISHQETKTKEDNFYATWDSVENYYTYCFESCDSDDIDYLVSHADEYNMVYFTVDLGEKIYVMIVPVACLLDGSTCMAFGDGV